MGVIKPADAAIMVAMTKGMGSTPSPLAAEIATGNIRIAAAVLVNSSVKTTVATYNSLRVLNGSDPAQPRRKAAAKADTPVLYRGAPSTTQPAQPTNTHRH